MSRVRFSASWSLRRRYWLPTCLAVVSTMLLGTACGSSSPTSSSHTVVTFAEQPGSTPDYVFPLAPGEFFTFANDQEFSYLLYPPLYWIDTTGRPILNEQMSLALPPKFSVNSAHETVATITLKDIHWSDGVRLTSRDVRFWMNLLFANKANWGDYVPGEMPDNVKSVAYPSASQFAITFNRTYSPTWLTYSELSTIIPMPQHAWDRTSLTGPVRNYDYTTKGAVAVWNFLNGQSKIGTTYATNPLWKVVDGPWRIEPKVGYNASTGYLVLVPNHGYFGPANHKIAKFEELPFTSDAAEFNTLRSGGVDYGYLPLEDNNSGQRAALKSEGYRFDAWNIWGWNFWGINFAQPTAGPIFRQLYIRQALEHLVNQQAWVKFILRGLAYPEYSDIPLSIPNPYADSFIKQDHYPYSVAAARQLLSSHGWKVVSKGVTTCARPGSGATDCGAGIKAGAALNFSLEFSSGSLPLEEEVIAYQTAASQVGIKLSLTSHPFSKVFADYFSCFGVAPSACHWQLIAGTLSNEYGWYPYYYPDGGENYRTGSGFNGGQYSNPTMDRLVAAAHEQPGPGPLHAAENFEALQLPTLWVPNAAYQLSAIKTNLQVPWQGLETNVYPQLWSWSG